MTNDITTLSQLMPDVPLEHLPSAWQYEKMKDWVDWEAGADPSGEFNGSCLLHDQEKEMTSAVYNFQRGYMRCQGQPSCHAPKRAMSIVNALNQWATSQR